MLRTNIPDSHKLIEIKNLILCSPSFDENVKNIINNIFDIIIKYLIINNNSIKTINSNNSSSLNVQNNFNFNCLDNQFSISNFSDLNIKIFSSSELKKYHMIYDEKTKNINELINIYIKRVNDIKNDCNGFKINYDSTISSNMNDDIPLSFMQNNNHDNKYKKNKEISVSRLLDWENNYKSADTGYEYKNIHEEIIKLKNEKIILDNLIELLKNYLIINEKVFYKFCVQNKNIDKYKKYTSETFEIFKNCCCYNMDEISDNIIFHKKLIIKLFEMNFLHI